MSMFMVVLVETCWIYEPIYVSSNVWCYKCVNKATIDDITMIEWCMIMMGFGKVWEHDNHTLKVYMNYKREECVLILERCISVLFCW